MHTVYISMHVADRRCTKMGLRKEGTFRRTSILSSSVVRCDYGLAADHPFLSMISGWRVSAATHKDCPM